jgi:hypothetical protein
MLRPGLLRMNESVAGSGRPGTFKHDLLLWVARCIAAVIGPGKLAPGVMASLRGVEASPVRHRFREGAI